MKTYCVKIGDADLIVGAKVNVAIVERIYDRQGDPLADSLCGTMDCEIVSIGVYWSDQPHGRSGRHYEVMPLSPMPEREGRTYTLGL